MRRTLQRAMTSGYRRTALVGGLTVALLAGAWGTASGQESPPETPPISNGTAKATAVVARVAPGVGALQLGISGGVAVSEVKTTIAQASAKALDLGLIGSTLTQESCGRAAVVTPNDLPQPVTVDSRGGAVSKRQDQAPLLGSTLGAGWKEAKAAPSPPTSSAVSTLVGSSIPGLLTLDAGRSEATTKVLPGDGREAHARVSVGLDLAGLVKLQGLTWDAYHRTGKSPKATASFDIGTGSLLGVPIPLESLAQTEKAINSALAFTGLSITFPRVERFTTPSDLIRITPLRIVLQDTPVGKAVLGPVLNLTRAQRVQLFDQLAKAACDAAAAILLGDVGLDVVSGTGFLAIEIGGAEALSGSLVLDSPFGQLPGPSQPNPVVALPSFPSNPTLPFLPGPSANPGAPVQRTASIGPLEDHCESEHPIEHTACSKGALMAVGLVGVLATAAVAALDWRHQRRRRAKAAEAVAGAAP
jgi:hypothetical protein